MKKFTDEMMMIAASRRLAATLLGKPIMMSMLMLTFSVIMTVTMFMSMFVTMIVTMIVAFTLLGTGIPGVFH